MSSDVELALCAQAQDFEKLDEIYENVESVNERLKSADA